MLFWFREVDFRFSCQDSWGAGEVDFSYPDAGADSAALVGDLEDKTILKQFLGTTTVDLGLWFSCAPFFCIRLVPKFAIPNVSWSEGISWNCSVEAVLFQNSQTGLWSSFSIFRCWIEERHMIIMFYSCFMDQKHHLTLAFSRNCCHHVSPGARHSQLQFLHDLLSMADRLGVFKSYVTRALKVSVLGSNRPLEHTLQLWKGGWGFGGMFQKYVGVFLGWRVACFCYIGCCCFFF